MLPIVQKYYYPFLYFSSNSEYEKEKAYESFGTEV